MKLIKKLHELGIQLTLNNDDLKIKAPKGVLTPDLVSQIKEEKENLLALISNLTYSNIIPLSPPQEYYPLSSSQRRLWVLSQFEGGNMAYNIPGIFQMKGTLDIDVLTASFGHLIARHESLRTRFVTKEEEVYQQIVNEQDIAFTIDKQEFLEGDVEDLITSFYKETFDLGQAPLLKARVLQTSTTDYYLLFAIHHIIGDGWSMEVLSKELMYVYNHLLSNTSFELPELRIQYKEYILWQESEDIQHRLLVQESYWKEKLSGELPVLELPSYHKRPLIKTYNGATKLYDFSQELSAKLNSFCKAQGVTLYMSLLSGVNGLLYRYTNATDIILGTPIAGRSHPELEHQVGLYLNTLAIRTIFDTEDSFASLLEKQKQTLLEAYEHQDYPLDRLVEDLALKRDTSRSALFDVMVVLQNQQETFIELDNLEISGYQGVSRKVSQFDMTFSFSEDSTGIHLRVEYNSDIYDIEQVDRMCIHLERFIDSALHFPKQSISTLSYLTDTEEKELLYTFNTTEVAYPKDKTVVDLFRNQVTKNPESTAIIHQDKELTYQELEVLSNAMANDLLATGLIEKETLISVALERSEWLIVSLLAVLKTGGAYVPIDPSYPKQRIDYIKENSQCAFVITEDYIEEFKQKEKDRSAPEIALDTDQLAYIIYTSGSTGKPKGVMIEHKSLINLCFWHKETYNLDQNTRSTLYSSTAFDASVWEIFPYLCFGGCLFPISNDDIRLDAYRLSSFLEENQITHCFLPPKAIQELKYNIFTGGLKILAGGEELTTQNIEGYELYNNYGPTENTVVTTSYKIFKESPPPYPIGRPIANVQACILSEDSKLQPLGIIGELCISGVGLSRGYLNCSELTEEKFIPHPFKEGERLYKTGDLAKWLPNGTIEFIGRKDSQVKIRGYRVELGEIEYALTSQENISQAVVTIAEHHEEKYLAAHVVHQGSLDVEALKNSLRQYLPMYMIPNYIIKIDTIPLTPNGKIDRESLPVIKIDEIVVNKYVAPRNAVEEQLVIIWQEILGVERVGITDNFFELGGHSLKVTRLINKMNKKLSSTFKIKDIFDNPTIEYLVMRLQLSEYIEIPVASIQDYYPLTPQQYYLWLLCQNPMASKAYNIPLLYKLKGKVNKVRFINALDELLKRHESLRTMFIIIDHHPKQKILSMDDINNTYFFFEEKEESDVFKLLKERIEHPFDLNSGPLIKVYLSQVLKDEYILLINIHHIIADGWSMNIIINDLLNFYNNDKEYKDVEPIGIQYKDYAIWYENLDLQNEKEFWYNQFNTIPEKLIFNSNEGIDTHRLYKGEYVGINILLKSDSKLVTFCKKNNITNSMLLLSLSSLLLYKYTGKTDIVFITGVANRDNKLLENQVGFYVSSIPIRVQFSEENSIENFLISVKNTLVDSYSNQRYSYGKLIEDFHSENITIDTSIFNLGFTYQKTSFDKRIIDKNINLERINYNSTFSKFDMSFFFIESENDIRLELEYKTDFLNKNLVKKLGESFNHILSIISDNEKICIKNINIVKKQEEEAIFNLINN